MIDLGVRTGSNNTNQSATQVQVSVSVASGDSILLFTDLSRDDNFTLSCSAFPGGGPPTINGPVGGYYTGDNVGNQTYGIFVVVNPGPGSYTFSWAGTPVGNSWPDIDAFPIVGGETSSFANLVVENGPGNFQNNPATTTDLVTSGAARDPSPNYPCLVVGVSVDSNAAQTPAAGTGFLSAGVGLGAFGGAGGRVITKRITSGTAQALFTATSSGGLLATLMIVLKEASGGTPAVSAAPASPAIYFGSNF